MVIVLIWAAMGVIGYFIGKNKGRAGLGAALGVVLGVIGVIIIAVMSETQERRIDRIQQDMLDRDQARKVLEHASSH